MPGKLKHISTPRIFFEYAPININLLACQGVEVPAGIGVSAACGIEVAFVFRSSAGTFGDKFIAAMMTCRKSLCGFESITTRLGEF